MKSLCEDISWERTPRQKRVLIGEVAVRTRDLLHRIAAEHEVEILTGKVASDHVHMFIAYRPAQPISKLIQYFKGTSSRLLLSEFQHLRKQFWGRHFWA